MHLLRPCSFVSPLKPVHVVAGLAAFLLACAPAPVAPKPPEAPTTAPAKPAQPAAPAAPATAPAASPAAASAAPAASPAAAGVAASPAAPAGAASKPSAQLTTVMVGIVPNINVAPVFIAVEKGYYTEHGLDAKLKTVASGVVQNTALNAGDIQIATSNFEPLISALASDGLGKAFAFYQNDPTKLSPDDAVTLLTAKPEIKTIADLKGKRIAAQPGGIFTSYAEKILAANGVDPKSVELVPLQNYSDIEGAIIRGGLDAGVFTEPYGVLCLANNPGAHVLSRGGGYVLSRVTITARRDWMPANADTMERAAAAAAQATQFIRQRPQEAAEITSRWLAGIPAPVIQEAFKYVGYDPRLSNLTIQSWDVVNDGLISLNKIKRRVPWSEGFDPTIPELLPKKYPQYFSDLPPLPR